MIELYHGEFVWCIHACTVAGQVDGWIKNGAGGGVLKYPWAYK